MDLNQNNNQKTMQNNKLIIPVSIVLAGALIGGAMIYSKNPPANPSTNQQAAATTAIQKTVNIKPVTSTDHILGNPDAKLLMVEYSDTECPYCKLFSVTMEKLMDTYGKDGTVAWVYRQYPIVQLHPKAPKEAEATECVNKLAGNDVFWKYLENIYAVTPGNNGLDAAQLPIMAVQFGVNKTAFQACLDSGTFTAQIQSDVADANASGAQGTPYTIIVPKTAISDATVKQVSDMFATAAAQYHMTDPSQLGFVSIDKKVVLNGNLPYDLVQQIIAALIS